MNEIIERASRAHSPSLWTRIDELAATGEPADDLRREALARMRDAIRALRDPTEAMMHAKVCEEDRDLPVDTVDGYLDYWCADAVWRAMIDAALADN